MNNTANQEAQQLLLTEVMARAKKLAPSIQTTIEVSAKVMAPNNLRSMDDLAQKRLLFDMIRGKQLQAVKHILTAVPQLLTSRMYGHYGLDCVLDLQCYKYTGDEVRGEFFYPLHAAARIGDKAICLYLLTSLREEDPRAHLAIDSHAVTAEDRSIGSSAHDAFMEIIHGHTSAAIERYEGMTRKNDHGEIVRHGQGKIFYKSAGYNSKEYVLYSGGFKDGQYSGMGTLCWKDTHGGEGNPAHWSKIEGSDAGGMHTAPNPHPHITILISKYHGRFRSGQQHGQGTEYDQLGNKRYKGNFRHGKRQGRGSAYDPPTAPGLFANTDWTQSESALTYYGEWSNGLKHGYGVEYTDYDGLKCVFVGQYDQGTQTGLAIFYNTMYRVECMYINAVPVGHASFYSVDDLTQAVVAKHCVIGLKGGEPFKVVDVNVAFKPDSTLIPLSAEHETEARLDNHDYVFKSGPSLLDPLLAPAGITRPEDATGSVDGTEKLNNYSTIVNWKALIAKYLKLPHATAKLLGMDYEGEEGDEPDGSGDENVQRRRSRKGSQSYSKRSHSFLADDSLSAHGEESDDDVTSRSTLHSRADEDLSDEDSDEEDDELGTNWKELIPLRVAFRYVKKAGRIFEGRAAHHEFEEVHDAVYEAIETYEDKFQTRILDPMVHELGANQQVEMSGENVDALGREVLDGLVIDLIRLASGGAAEYPSEQGHGHGQGQPLKRGSIPTFTHPSTNPSRHPQTGQRGVHVADKTARRRMDANVALINSLGIDPDVISKGVVNIYANEVLYLIKTARSVLAV